MSKKLILVLAGVGVVLVGGAIGFFFSRGEGNSDSLVPEGAFSGFQKIEIEGEEVYQDASGFSFKYPKGAEVKDVTPDGSQYYAVLEITHPKTRGMLTISISDTEFSTLDGWAKENVGAKLVGAVSLGKIPAKQYEFSSGGPKLLIVAVDQGILYEINFPVSHDFWEESANLLASSFLFGLERAESPSAGQNVIYEEEEVVE